MPKTVWWTGAEVMILRKHYASLGAKGVAPMLPNRSIFAITQAAQRLGITAADERLAGDGLTVMHVLPNSRGEKIGLKEGDVIQKVNGKEVHSTAELRKAVTDNPKRLVIEGTRDGKAIKLEEKAE